MSVKRPRVVILGILGRTPFAGVAWQVLQYLEGFRRLGCDVYYVEDTGDWPYDLDQNTITDDCSYTIAYISRLMAWCGLEDRWAYRSGATGEVDGLSAPQISSLFKECDALINLTGATVLRDGHLNVPIRIYLETDPVLPQIEIAQGRPFTIDLLSAHTHHFTYGENLGESDCGVPVSHFTYYPTRQPVVLNWWTEGQNGANVSPTDGCFTTIANWQQSGKDIVWNSETYFWSKHLEFLKFIDLPSQTEETLELALACGDDAALRLLRSHGWRTVDAMAVSKDMSTYRSYILGSRGEFTVAKDQNIRLRSGWFSDRSACYLAAGKPVITQDTAFAKQLPTGQGLFSFHTMDDIVEALDDIKSDYAQHSRAAREIAMEHFAAEKVIGNLMKRVGL